MKDDRTENVVRISSWDRDAKLRRKELCSSIKQYIGRHLKDELTLDELADIAGYSKFHMLRMFREETGVTLHRYIQSCRLSYAAEQLITSQKPIVEIALETNYQSQTAFTLAFRQEYQCTPMVYRQKNTSTITGRMAA